MRSRLHRAGVAATLLGLAPFALSACAGGPPATAPADTTTPTPAITAPKPQDLIGLDATALERALGLPGLKRTDPPAEIWQYAGAACTVNVFLYSDGTGGAHRVEHIEAHDAAGQTTDAQACLSRPRP